MADIILTEEQTKKVKDVELDLLKKFINICSKLNIKYYALGGTMLGAVRHNGFIPWDDDIDVGLSRKDFEIFCEKAQQYLPENVFLQTRTTDPDYIAGFAKLRNSDTTFKETSVKTRKINHGIYIDIFPIDFYPEKKFSQKVIDLKCRLIKLRLRKEYTLDERGRGSLKKRFLMALISPIAFICYPSLDYTCKARERLFTSVPESKMIVNYNGAWGKREIWHAEWFSDECELKFEDTTIRVPAQYHEYLTNLYGDYMTPPPVEKRVTHHYCVAIDPDKSYKEYEEVL